MAEYMQRGDKTILLEEDIPLRLNFENNLVFIILSYLFICFTQLV